MPLDVMLLLKVAGVGIIVALVHTLLKQAGRDDQGQMVTLVGFLLVMMTVVGLMSRFFYAVMAFAR
jgi:stage III sporulation protein AC